VQHFKFLKDTQLLPSKAPAKASRLNRQKRRLLGVAEAEGLAAARFGPQGWSLNLKCGKSLLGMDYGFGMFWDVLVHAFLWSESHEFLDSHR